MPLSTEVAFREREAHRLQRLPGYLEVEFGHESRLRTARALHDGVHFSEVETQAFRHGSEVHAGYLAAERSRGGFRAQAGVRVEAERSRAELDSVIARSEVRVFPSASAQWTDFSRALVYRVGFSRRITRPDARMLNMFAMGDGEAEEVLGDPFLLPEVDVGCCLAR